MQKHWKTKAKEISLNNWYYSKESEKETGNNSSFLCRVPSERGDHHSAQIPGLESP